jgi:hypothetical protein
VQLRHPDESGLPPRRVPFPILPLGIPLPLRRFFRLACDPSVRGSDNQERTTLPRAYSVEGFVSGEYLHHPRKFRCHPPVTAPDFPPSSNPFSEGAILQRATKDHYLQRAQLRPPLGVPAADGTEDPVSFARSLVWLPTVRGRWILTEFHIPRCF